MRTTGHNMDRVAVAVDLAASAAGALVGCGAIALAAGLFGCGDAEAKKPGSPAGGAVLAAPNGGGSTVAPLLAADGSAAVEPASFTRDAGGRLLDDHLSPPQYVPIEPPPAAVASPRPLPKVEGVNFEQLWQPPAEASQRLVLPLERHLADRRLPLRDLPPLASSLSPLPPSPALAAGPLLLAASRDAEDAFELVASPATPEALSAGDPATVAARAVAHPVISSSRAGPSPFVVVTIPVPQEFDLPRLPTVKSPPTDLDVFPASTSRPLAAPAMPVTPVTPTSK